MKLYLFPRAEELPDHQLEKQPNEECPVCKRPSRLWRRRRNLMHIYSAYGVDCTIPIYKCLKCERFFVPPFNEEQLQWKEISKAELEKL